MSKVQIQIDPKDSPELINILISQLSEYKDLVEIKSREARDSRHSLNKAESELIGTTQILKEILTPLVENSPALYLIHENSIVRNLAKEILLYRNAKESIGELKGQVAYSTSRGY